ncbi:hypothetical protein [Halorubrum ezzemoulense]|uniref:hypothetical protein n=1 Tax=Halorubrum ezzemoulense TaxID=337243 RepID=UPI00117AE21D|nr:hypothetical protein [Halorubrum ezzemoulense]
MVTFDTFFSTLASATAALLGFVFALGTVLYQFERRRVEQVTDELREDFSNMKEKYAQNFNLLSSVLESKIEASEGIDSPTKEESDNVSLYDGDKRKDANEVANRYDSIDRIEYPYIRAAYYFMNRILHILAQISQSESRENNYLLTEEQIKDLNFYVEELNKFFSSINDTGDEFRKEWVAVTGSYNEDEIFYVPIFRDLYDEHYSRINPGKELNEWLDRNVDKNDIVNEKFLSGLNLYSIEKFIDLFRSDLQKANIKREKSVLNYDPIISEFLTVGFLLVVLCIILPLVMLLLPPADSFFYTRLLIFVAIVCACSLFIGVSYLIAAVHDDMA